MKAIVTGLNGTIAPYLKEELEHKGIDVIKWDREQVSPGNEVEMIRFLDEIKPDLLYHLSNGTVEWTAFLANYTKEHHIKFLYTSTESVFAEDQKGPFTIFDEPKATSDYGIYKIKSEQVIRHNNNEAYIIRYGWQIGDEFKGNNMLNYLETTYQKEGKVEASTNWILSTGYIKETVKWLVKIILEMEPRLYHIEGNDHLSFYELVKRIEEKYNKNWNIIPVENPSRVNQLIDERLNVKKVTEVF